MPIYEYSCENCGNNLEVMQSIKDEPLLVCPECKKPTLIKLVSAAAFRLKGGGWYETDFKDSDKKKNLVSSSTDQPRETKETNATNTTKETNTETKTATETATKPNTTATDSSTQKREST